MISAPSKAALVACVALLACVSFSASANDDTLQGRAELQKAVESLRLRPSTDATPVEFSIGNDRYRIPRNYLVTMDNWNGGPQSLVSLHVNIPDLAPFSEKTRACFTASAAALPPGCQPLQFNITLHGLVSVDQAFNNVKSLFRKQEPMAGPSGFERYAIGEDSNGLDYFRKIEFGRTNLYWCHTSYDNGTRNGLCRPVADWAATDTGLQFFFSLRELPDITRLDESLRGLVEHFALRPADGK
jgi:hypothetical protein